jgi:hypothetical protein
MRKLAVLVVVLGIACGMYAQKGDAEKRAAEMVSKNDIGRENRADVSDNS